MWFPNRRLFHANYLQPARLWKAQINFSVLTFWGNIICKKKKCFLHPWNFQSWEKPSPVASSAFSGALHTGIGHVKSSEISKWRVCEHFATNLNLHVTIQEMKRPCMVLSLQFSQSRSEVLFWSGELSWSCWTVGTFIIWAKELVPQLVLWQWVRYRVLERHLGLEQQHRQYKIHNFEEGFLWSSTCLSTS